MVTLYVDGAKIGTLADAAALITRFAAQRTAIEFRDEDGNPIGTFTPAPGAICPWEPDLTHAELDRRAAAPGGSTLRDILRRVGVE